MHKGVTFQEVNSLMDTEGSIFWDGLSLVYGSQTPITLKESRLSYTWMWHLLVSF